VGGVLGYLHPQIKPGADVRAVGWRDDVIVLNSEPGVNNMIFLAIRLIRLAVKALEAYNRRPGQAAR
jgi:hypothetical protein